MVGWGSVPSTPTPQPPVDPQSRSARVTVPVANDSGGSPAAQSVQIIANLAGGRLLAQRGWWPHAGMYDCLAPGGVGGGGASALTLLLCSR